MASLNLLGNCNRCVSFAVSSLFSAEFALPSQIHIPLDRATQSSKGLAYATFSSGEAALRAFEELDLRSFQGRLLHILPAIGRSSGEVKDSKAPTLKGERLENRKQEAGKGLSWGTLYMNVSGLSSGRIAS